MGRVARKGYAADMVPYMLDKFPFGERRRVFVEAGVRLLNELYEFHP